MPITKENLKSIGFIPSGKEGVYSKRIHERVFIEFDASDGFVTLARSSEHQRHYIGHDKEFDRVTLPGKRDTVEKLSALTSILEGVR